MGNISYIRKAVLKALLIPLSFSVVCSCSSVNNKKTHSKKTNVVYECALNHNGGIYGVKFFLGKHPRAYVTNYGDSSNNTTLAMCHYSYDSNNRKWLVCLVHKEVEISKGLFDSYSQDITKYYVIFQPDEDKAYWAEGYNSTGWCSSEHAMGVAIKTLDLGITNDEELCEIAVDHHCAKITQ